MAQVPSLPPADATSAPAFSPHTTLALPKVLTYPSSSAPQLITQGAEALLFKSTYLQATLPCAFKYRPSKPYRHPILDARLTRHRIFAEARVLTKCRREDVPVPAVYALDEARGWLMMEWIEGEVVRIRLNECLKRRKDLGVSPGSQNADIVDLLRRVGKAVGRLHAIGVVHGDLTTSNLMLRPRENDDDTSLKGDIVLIDFGLASQSIQEEDRAVDLYVLERAYGSTHPSAESLFGEVLISYGQSFKGAASVLKRLDEVRMRGRKRSMLG